MAWNVSLHTETSWNADFCNGVDSGGKCDLLRHLRCLAYESYCRNYGGPQWVVLQLGGCARG